MKAGLLRTNKPPPSTVHYITKELNEFANSFKQKPVKCVCEWILRLWNDGGRNIKLDQAESIDMNSFSGDSRLNMVASTVKKNTSEVCLKGWLKHLSKDGVPKRS